MTGVKCRGTGGPGALWFGGPLRSPSVPALTVDLHDSLTHMGKHDWAVQREAGIEGVEEPLMYGSQFFACFLYAVITHWLGCSRLR